MKFASEICDILKAMESDLCSRAKNEDGSYNDDVVRKFNYLIYTGMAFPGIRFVFKIPKQIIEGVD